MKRAGIVGLLLLLVMIGSVFAGTSSYDETRSCGSYCTASERVSYEISLQEQNIKYGDAYFNGVQYHFEIVDDEYIVVKRNHYVFEVPLYNSQAVAYLGGSQYSATLDGDELIVGSSKGITTVQLHKREVLVGEFYKAGRLISGKFDLNEHTLLLKRDHSRTIIQMNGKDGVYTGNFIYAGMQYNIEINTFEQTARWIG